jgi:predicted TIM-barrel fold metal-dependent hydrolase
MLPSDVRLFSVDDHLVEPPETWISRLANKFHDRCPQVVKGDDGRDTWRYEGHTYPVNSLGAVAGLKPEDFSTDAANFADMRRACYDPVARLEDMDADGVHVQTCFPTFARFGGARFLVGTDREMSLLCVRAYNDFVLDEWCAAAPDRYVPVVILPLWDPELGAKELERCISKGAKAVAFVENPPNVGLPSWHGSFWDPVFAVANEAEVPICMHIGSSGKLIDGSAESPYAVHVALTGCNSMVAAVDLVYSRTFQKFPKLKVVLSEGEAGWAPHLLERMDYVWERHRYHSGLDTETRPSDLFKAHIWLCFISDDHALRNRHEIGIERLMWESDYPHSDSLWPESGMALAKAFADLPDAEAHAIAELNARAVFKFDGLLR